jgi:Rap1a immunity proteins
MRSITGAAALIALAWAGFAAADMPQAMTAADLRDLCSGTDHVSVNACRIYILGVTQGIRLGLEIAAGKLRAGRACVPADTSAQALDETIKKQLDAELTASPAHGTHDAAAFIGQALGASYPCAKNGQ